jgi:hypothetical protein
MCDTLGIMNDHNFSSYPNDLENLIHFLRINAKAQSSSNAQSIKGSSFTAKKTSLYQAPIVNTIE